MKTGIKALEAGSATYVIFIFSPLGFGTDGIRYSREDRSSQLFNKHPDMIRLSDVNAILADQVRINKSMGRTICKEILDGKDSDANCNDTNVGMPVTHVGCGTELKNVLLQTHMHHNTITQL